MGRKANGFDEDDGWLRLNSLFASLVWIVASLVLAVLSIDYGRYLQALVFFALMLFGFGFLRFIAKNWY